LTKCEYEPYGKPQYNGDKSVVGYTGHEYTAESGLSYMKARWYEPELGRFLSPDPVQYQPGNPTSFNRYAYANNSPYMFVDPDGRAGEFAALRYTVAVMMVDAATADPSDVAAPVKGAGYLGAVIGTAIGGSLYWAGNKIISGPDTQGTPPGGDDDRNVDKINGPKFGMLKDHAHRHSLPGQSTNSYYNSAVQHTRTGQAFRVRHGGSTKTTYVTRTGNNSFTFTSTSRSGKRIYTHMYNVRKDYLLNKGITLPKGF